MSKAVLLSIRPEWCEKIASGKKTVEVRKTRPKLKAPFKVYIYCTSGKEKLWVLRASERKYVPEKVASIFDAKDVGGSYKANGKVIGEFVCDKIFSIRYRCGSYRCEGLMAHENDRIAAASQLSLYDMRNYLSCNGGYGWHISDLVVYDKPRELSEFVGLRRTKFGYEPNKITRPPQSWCYVEEQT